MFKKYLILNITIATVLWSIGANILLPTATKVANAASLTSCSSLKSGDLIKVYGRAAIYALDEKMEYRYFPTGDEFKSWFADEKYSDKYKKISQSCFDSLSSSARGINFRPGSYLIKKKFSDQLYTISPENGKGKIDTAAARALYGDDYLSKVKEIHPVFWANYVNNDLDINGADAKPHPGMLTKVNNVIYYVNKCRQLRELTTVSFVTNRFKQEFVRPLISLNVLGMDKVDKINIKSPAISNVAQLNVDNTCVSGSVSGTPTPASTPPVSGNTGNTGVGSNLYLSLFKDGAYNNQEIQPPKNNYLIGQYDLVNDKDEDVVLKNIKLNLALVDDFQTGDLANVYIEYGSKSTSKKVTVELGENIWDIDSVLSKKSNINVKVYADIKAGAAGTNNTVDKLVTLVEFTGKISGDNTDVYSGPGGTDMLVDGQLITAKGSSVVPPPPPPPPVPPATLGKLTLNKNLGKTPGIRQPLTGSSEYVLGLVVGATEEDIYLTNLKFNELLSPSAIDKIELYVSGDDVSYTLLGVVKSLQSDIVEWKWNTNDTGVYKIKKDNAAWLALKVTYATGSSVAGLESQFSLLDIDGKGALSSADISPAIGDVKSNKATLAAANQQPPVTPGTLILNIDLSKTPAEKQVLSGSTEEALVLKADAVDEDIYITSIKFKELLSPSAISQVALYVSEDGSNYSLLGAAGALQADSKEWKWLTDDVGVYKIKKDSSIYLSLRPTYKADLSALGLKSQFAWISMKGAGADSLKEMSLIENLQSNKALIVSIKPKISALAVSDLLIEDTELSLFKFQVEADNNNTDPGLNRLDLKTIDLTVNKGQNVTLKKLQIKSNTAPFPVHACSAWSQTKWRCDFSTAVSLPFAISEGSSETYTIIGDTGIRNNTNGDLQISIASLGSISSAGDVTWRDSGDFTEYSWVNQVGNSIQSRQLTGPGSGTNYDNVSPEVIDINYINKGSQVGVPEDGDEIIVKFDEIIDPTSIHPNLVPGGAAISIRENETGSLIIGSKFVLIELVTKYTDVEFKGIGIDTLIAGGGITPDTYTSYPVRLSLNSDGKTMNIILGSAGTVASNKAPLTLIELADINNNKTSGNISVSETGSF